MSGAQEATEKVRATSRSCSHRVKAGAPSKRSSKKADPGKSASTEVPGPAEDVEKNQKIMQWIIEGEKEISRHRKAGHG